MSEEVLKSEELEEALKDCPMWEVEGESIMRRFEFEDFNDAMEFVNLVAEVAEAAQHHPDIDIRYNKVTLHLETHEIHGVTEADVELATRIDNLE